MNEFILEKDHILHELQWNLQRLQKNIAERTIDHYTAFEMKEIEYMKNQLEIIWEMGRNK